MDMGEIARIVASNAARIDMAMWLRSEPYHSGVTVAIGSSGLLQLT